MISQSPADISDRYLDTYSDTLAHVGGSVRHWLRQYPSETACDWEGIGYFQSGPALVAILNLYRDREAFEQR